MKKIKIAIYARTAAQQQSHETSAGNQVLRALHALNCGEYLEKDGGPYKLVTRRRSRPGTDFRKLHFVDEGFSPTEWPLERGSALAELLLLVESGVISAIMMDDIGRLSRIYSAPVAAHIFAILRKSNAKILTPAGEHGAISVKVLSAMARREKRIARQEAQNV